ncbi:MAG: hypothetical protein KAR39_12805 [Thermoplasmata archaeon]|nr:hypothetical protein [Thermoplasmata archaeon]
MNEQYTPYVKLNAGKTVEVLASRIKVARHDALYLNCPWCDHKITDTEMFVTGTGECKQCGLTIDIKEVHDSDFARSMRRGE